MQLYIIRHGQTTGDIEDRYGGDYDDHLTELGKHQAGNLSEKLVNFRIQKIFTSPLIRAVETTEILIGKLHVPSEIVQDFRERNGYGILSGMTKTEALEKHPELIELLTDYKNTVTGGEAYGDLLIRVRRGLDNIANSGLDTVAIVTHGGVIRSLFRSVVQLGEIKLGDCSYAVLNSDSTGLHLVSLAGISLT